MYKLNFKIWNFVCLFPTKFSKIGLKTFSQLSCQNRKSELSIDRLIISGSLQRFDVRKRKNKFCKISQNCNLSALLNFTFLFHFSKKRKKMQFVNFCNQMGRINQNWWNTNFYMFFTWGRKKSLSLFFENFVENRQNKFHILKFRVCVNTHQIWTREIHFVCFPQIFKNRTQKFFHVKIENQSFRLMG